MTDSSWMERAACAGTHDDPRYAWDAGTGIPTEGFLDRLAAAQRLCLTSCPVINLCESQATADDFRYTIRAGRYPAYLTKTKTCAKGHAYQGAQCGKCKTELARARADRRRSERLEKEPLSGWLTRAMIEAGRCLQGHPVAHPAQRGSGTARYRCNACFSAYASLKAQQAQPRLTCIQGHDTSAPDSWRLYSGVKRCVQCVSERNKLEGRKRNQRKRGAAPAAPSVSAPVCVNGHDKTLPGATYTRRDGSKVCRKCRAEGARRRRLAKAAQAV